MCNTERRARGEVPLAGFFADELRPDRKIVENQHLSGAHGLSL
jgi:hypothetical protein